MKQHDLAAIFCTHENLGVVKKTLPLVIKESLRTNSALVVHDSSVNNTNEKWSYLHSMAIDSYKCL